MARTAVPPETLIETAKLAVWGIDPLQTFYRTATLDELVERTLTTRRFALIVLTGFAALALLLAAAGLYGVLSAIVSQYRREIGVRMALGAAWPDILRLVVGRGLVVSAIGVAAGLVAVLGGARILQSFLFSVAPTDPVAIGGAAVLMLTIAAIACYIPARRAAGEDPVQALTGRIAPGFSRGSPPKGGGYKVGHRAHNSTARHSSRCCGMPADDLIARSVRSTASRPSFTRMSGRKRIVAARSCPRITTAERPPR